VQLAEEPYNSIDDLPKHLIILHIIRYFIKTLLTLTTFETCLIEGVALAAAFIANPFSTQIASIHYPVLVRSLAHVAGSCLLIQELLDAAVAYDEEPSAVGNVAVLLYHMVADAPVRPFGRLEVRIAQVVVVQMMTAVAARILPVLLHLLIGQTVFGQTVNEFLPQLGARLFHNTHVSICRYLFKSFYTFNLRRAPISSPRCSRPAADPARCR
jgi:hypothetical protein